MLRMLRRDAGVARVRCWLAPTGRGLMANGQEDKWANQAQCPHLGAEASVDVWYVDHWSLWLDLKIILLTLWKTFKREGISQPGQATMEEFRGEAVGLDDGGATL